MSDVILDTLKVSQNPPSRAQVSNDSKNDKIPKGNALSQIKTN